LGVEAEAEPLEIITMEGLPFLQEEGEVEEEEVNSKMKNSA